MYGAVSYGIYELLRRYQLARGLLNTLAVCRRAGLEALFESLLQPVKRLFTTIGEPEAALFNLAVIVPDQ